MRHVGTGTPPEAFAYAAMPVDLDEGLGRIPAVVRAWDGINRVDARRVCEWA